MDYVGIDPAVGLECSHCHHISRIAYSRLLQVVSQVQRIQCENCARQMLHDWTTVGVVQNIIKERMIQANDRKSRRSKRRIDAS